MEELYGIDQKWVQVYEFLILVQFGLSEFMRDLVEVIWDEFGWEEVWRVGDEEECGEGN